MRASRQSAKVRVFIDFWNFAHNWRDLTGQFPEHNLDWGELPQAILDGLNNIPLLRHVHKELRAVKVYASVRPNEHLIDGSVSPHDVQVERSRRDWLQNNLDQLISYTVDITTQSSRSVHCDACGCDSSQLIEQGVDTKIAIDLVSLASRDLYDIAVLVTDDQDLVPGTQCVQEALDKQVVHLGFRDKSSPVKLETWGHLFVDDMLSAIAI
jgi:uncharacterized LabA/DUF88 family protein